MNFKLKSIFQPSGDQPIAIEKLTDRINRGDKYQTLLGITGSGKTFTMANVIKNVNKPTLILSHNKTLASQLYYEFKQFFPNNLVEYYVSYYDYFKPEAYIPSRNVYMAKELSINDQLESLRLNTLISLLSERKDVIVISSVSCIYGIENPHVFKNMNLSLTINMEITQEKIIQELLIMLYTREEKKKGTFSILGDTIEIRMPYINAIYKIIFFDNIIEELQIITENETKNVDNLMIYPAKLFVISPEESQKVIEKIEKELKEQIDYFISNGKNIEAERLEERVKNDIDMLKTVGYCSGIENYSRFFDHRERNERPFCLLDYFPDDYLLFIDESHVTVPQIKAMYKGDVMRKSNLINNGFRLPSAYDNRPLTFEEFESLNNQVVFISATPSQYELDKSNNVVVEQLIRPTGLLDPEIEVHPTLHQIDDIVDNIQQRIQKNEAILITTLTKKMAEELNEYLNSIGIKSQYLHSEITTFERVKILDRLHDKKIDVLVGVNLLREGLDLPEVSLVMILDADKEGFLRNVKSLIQTIGRAARNIHGKVIMYADTISDAMKTAIEETERRRKIQIEYNKKNNIKIKPIAHKKIQIKEEKSSNIDITHLSKKDIKNLIDNRRQIMLKYADDLDFINANKIKEEIDIYVDYLKHMK